MRLGHVHVHVQDLGPAIDWFRQVLAAEPGYRDEEMAVFEFDTAAVILDQGPDDRAIVAFDVDDCDAAHREALRRGAKEVHAPEDKHYGVRASYVQGPGGLQIEFEQALRPQR